MRIIHAVLLAAVATIGVGQAHAADSVDWTALGPAWSKHQGTMAAMMRDVGSPTYVAGSDCSVAATSQVPPASALKSAGLPTVLCSASPDASLRSTRSVAYHFACGSRTAVSWGVIAPDDSWSEAQYGAASNCHLVAEHRVPFWHQMNPAFGLERTVRRDDTSDAMFVGFARDSYGSPTLMAGITHAWRVFEAGTLRADAGVTGGLWWRTEMRYVDTTKAFVDGTSNWYYEQRLVRRLEPVALPALSIVESHSGLGLNVTYAPKLRLGHYCLNETSTWMFQTTFLISRTAMSETKVGIEPQPGGAVASLTASF